MSGIAAVHERSGTAVELEALDRAMVLGDIRLLEKSGGRSGDWRAE